MTFKASAELIQLLQPWLDQFFCLERLQVMYM